jgi:hypothetical protein
VPGVAPHRLDEVALRLLHAPLPQESGREIHARPDVRRSMTKERLVVLDRPVEVTLRLGSVPE